MKLRLIDAVALAVREHRDLFTRLDQAIGDGDHGEAMQRGFDAIVAEREKIAAQTLPQGLVTAGKTLVMTMGGASGPLYGTFFMELGKALPEMPDRASLAAGFAHAVERVAARGKSEPGQKTLLDVLCPIAELLGKDPAAEPAQVAQLAAAAAEATVPMQAVRGRAAFLGERSVGHMDPGACSAALVIGTVCRLLEDEAG